MWKGIATCELWILLCPRPFDVNVVAVGDRPFQGSFAAYLLVLMSLFHDRDSNLLRARAVVVCTCPHIMHRSLPPIHAPPVLAGGGWYDGRKRAIMDGYARVFGQPFVSQLGGRHGIATEVIT